MQMFTNAPSLRTVALASMVVLGACSKKDDDATPTPAPAATTYATTWTAGSKNYTATISTGAVNNNSLTIGATQTVSSNESYSLTLVVPAATGTYTLGSSSNNSISAGYGSTVGGVSTLYSAASVFGSGTITVTTLSTTEIIGTFSVTASNLSNPSGASISLTNGKFAIKR